MGRQLFIVWTAAIVIATGFLWFIWSAEPDLYQQYPKERLPQINRAEIVFVGSSLTALLAPDPKTGGHVFGNQKTVSILATPGISERMTDRLIAHAMESGAQTLFVEVNAYVQDYIEYSRSYLDLGEPVFTARLARSLREFGARVTMNFKHQVFGIPFPQKTFYPSPVNGGSGSFDFNGLAVEEYYRILELNPAYPTEIRRLIQAAGASGVDLIFFSPPRPASAVHMLGEDRFARMLAHTEDVADDLGVPLWYSSSGWPDDHFIDIAAHVNARGRDRFLAELSGWYGSRQ